MIKTVFPTKKTPEGQTEFHSLIILAKQNDRDNLLQQ